MLCWDIAKCYIQLQAKYLVFRIGIKKKKKVMKNERKKTNNYQCGQLHTN